MAGNNGNNKDMGALSGDHDTITLKKSQLVEIVTKIVANIVNKT